MLPVVIKHKVAVKKTANKHHPRSLRNKTQTFFVSGKTELTRINQRRLTYHNSIPSLTKLVKRAYRKHENRREAARDLSYYIQKKFQLSRISYVGVYP
jgi:hypothetical protein